MKAFINQYNFRVDNQLKLLFELRNGPVSLNDLADKLNVSFTAIVKIVDQLKNENVLVFTKKQKTNRKGRKPSFVKINTKVGVTCAIDLSSVCIVVAISDLRNRILVKKEIKTNYFVSEENLYEIVDTIKSLLNAPEVEGRPLLGICVAAPGLINKNTGEFANSFKLKELGKFSLANFFFNQLGVKTQVYNDVKIGLVGERMFGCIPISAENYIFVHIGDGCSIAMTFDGKLYQGSHGYSGELSSFKNKDYLYSNITNNHLEDLTHICARIAKKHPEYELTSNEFMADTNKLIQLFNEGNKVVIEEVAANAKRNAMQVIAYNDVLDLEYIVISGTVLRIGETYKQLFLDSTNELIDRPLRAKILFSQLESPTLLGAVYQANNSYFLNKLEAITNEKSSTREYDISEAFGNNI